MAIKARNAVPALKDRFLSKFIDLSAMPALAGGSALLFMSTEYDMEVVSLSAVVTVVTTAVASPFHIGYAAFTDRYGIPVIADPSHFLTDALCRDANGQSFSTQVLTVGSQHLLPAPGTIGGTGTPILPRGAPLTVIGTNTANTGEILLSVILRPKDKDRGDASKRPGGASDYPYSS